MLSTLDLSKLKATQATRAESRWRQMMKLAADVLLPPVCAGCGLGGTWMCPDCATVVVTIDPTTACQRCGHARAPGAMCPRCINWPPALERCVSAYEFEEPVRGAIHRLKYQGEYARAEWVAGEMAPVLRALQWPVDVLVPVPLHKRKHRQRGFNQSERIAHSLGKSLDLPVVDALERTRDTVSQTTLDRHQRSANVDGAFAARYLMDGLHVVLVDDVVTTGSTLSECANSLAGAGATSVCALTLASG